MLEPMAGIEPATYSFAYTSPYSLYPERARLYLLARGEPLSVVRAPRTRDKRPSNQSATV